MQVCPPLELQPHLHRRRRRRRFWSPLEHREALSFGCLRLQQGFILVYQKALEN